MNKDLDVEKPRRTLARVGKIVDERVNRIQSAFTADDAPWARAALAQLRDGVQLQPGSDPRIWDWTQCGTPEDSPDSPTYEEWAVHIAMCLYAVHQQGKLESMHRPGFGLGRAVRLLAGDDSDLGSPVRKRFTRVLTADSVTDVAQSLRGIVGQLRSASPTPIALDYAMLADALYSWQFPESRDGVVLRWSRQYYQTRQAANDSIEKE